jgi:Protein of unknown function (DUF4242)
MLYTAKCYWPGVTAEELARASERALETTTRLPPGRSRAIYLGSVLFPGDDLVLCLFEADSRAAVKRASDAARIPCERVMDTLWISPTGASEVETALRDKRSK